MSGDCPGQHTTLVRSNDRFVTASISLGDLIHIGAYSSSCDERLFAVRFRHGSMDMNEAALADFINRGQDALKSKADGGTPQWMFDELAEFSAFVEAVNPYWREVAANA
jgi:hypothetical protein